ncbi:MAG: OmpH family outer membrane protein [Alphaproteobacteria bacterium]|jgi:Skp family chaperone for outer membrane proteins|nr:OmpH family outer membrane protein [Alphaproteobacteria bacterium]
MLKKSKLMDGNLIAVSLSAFAIVLSTFAIVTSPSKKLEERVVESGTKVGVVNIKYVQENAKVTKALNEQKDKYLKKLQKRTEDKKAELKKEEEKLKAQAKTLSQEALKEKVLAFQNEVMEFERETAVKVKAVQLSFSQEIQKVQMDHLNTILVSLAKEKGFDVLTQSSDSVVINSDFDLTKEVVDALNKKVSTLKMEDPSKLEAKIKKATK